MLLQTVHLVTSLAERWFNVQVTMKASTDVNADGRARMCRLALSLVLLSQGVPFIHAGDDLLRSKSLDRDSYNSGRFHQCGVGVLAVAVK